MVRRTIRLFLFFSYFVLIGVEPFYLYGQEKNKTTYPTPTPKHFSQLAMQELKNKDSTKFLEANKKAYQIALFQKDTMAMADAYWNYGAYHLNYKKFDSAYYYYNKSKNLYAQLDHHYYEAKMLYNMAFIKSKIKDYAGSEWLAFQSIKKFKALKKHESLYNSFNLLGVLFEEMQQYDKAIRYLKRAQVSLNRSNNHNKVRDQAGLLNNLGIIYQKKNNQNKAIEYFQKALSTNSLKSIDPQLFARLKDNLAYSKFLKKDSDKILPEFYQALRLRDSLNHKPGQIISHLHLAYYYLEHKDSIKAIKHADKALVLAKQIGLNRDILNAYQLLGKLKPTQAQAYFQKHTELEQRIKMEERKVRNNFAQIQFETNTYKTKNKKLTFQNIILWVGLAILLLFAVFIYVISKQQQKNKKLHYENLQNKANEKIYELELQKRAEWDKGRKLEKERIAEELHDGIVSKIFGLRLSWGFLKLLGTPKVMMEHQKNLEFLSVIESEIKAVSYDLKSEILEEYSQGFAFLIEKLAQEKEDVYRFIIKIDATQTISWEKINTPIKINLYRILEESLKNAYLHANCSKVIILFKVKNNALVVKIKDNGKGFQNSYASKGIGLKNVKNRIKKLKGQVSFKSSDKGLKIHLKIPIRS